MAASDPGIVFECAYCGKGNRVPYSRLTERAKCGACGKPVHGPGHPLGVDGGTLESLIAHAAVPVLVDFWAPWCGPCQAMAPELETLAGRLSRELIVAKLDTDQAPEAGARYNVRSIPLLVLFDRGREVWRTTGARPAARLEAEIVPFLRRAA